MSGAADWQDRLRREGTAIVLCSHVLPGVEAHIHRAAILTQGRLLALGSLALFLVLVLLYLTLWQPAQVLQSLVQLE